MKGDRTSHDAADSTIRPRLPSQRAPVVTLLESVVIHVNGPSQLFEIVRTLHPAGAASSGWTAGKSEANQHTNDSQSRRQLDSVKPFRFDFLSNLCF